MLRMKNKVNHLVFCLKADSQQVRVEVANRIAHFVSLVTSLYFLFETVHSK